MTLIDWTQITDDEVLAALRTQVQFNPTGASSIDVLDQLGGGAAINAALERLRASGYVVATTPGNYLPKGPR